MKKWWLAALILLTACALVAGPASAQSAQQGRYSIATASPGGTFYAYGGGWSNLLNQKLGFNTSTQVTGGGVDNLILLGNKKVDFGMTTTSEAHAAYLGEPKWTRGKKFDNLRALFMTHPAVLHVLSSASRPVRTIRDLDGKRVCLGPAGSGHDRNYRIIFNILGIKPARIINLPFGDAIRQLGDGQMDAIAMLVGPPNSSVMQFDATHTAYLAEFPQADRELINQKAPAIVPFTIGAGAYKSITKPVETTAVWAIMVADKDLPADVIYRIMKVTYENKPFLMAAHKAARFLEMKTILGSPIPLHAGAVKYYRETGLNITGGLVPPESK